MCSPTSVEKTQSARGTRMAELRSAYATKPLVAFSTRAIVAGVPMARVEGGELVAVLPDAGTEVQEALVPPATVAARRPQQPIQRSHHHVVGRVMPAGQQVGLAVGQRDGRTLPVAFTRAQAPAAALQEFRAALTLSKRRSGHAHVLCSPLLRWRQPPLPRTRVDGSNRIVASALDAAAVRHCAVSTSGYGTSSGKP